VNLKEIKGWIFSFDKKITKLWRAANTPKKILFLFVVIIILIFVEVTGFRDWVNGDQFVEPN